MNPTRIASPLRLLGQPSLAASAKTCQARWLHVRRQPTAIPPPIPLVPDVPTFLKVIGRDLKQHAEKFPSWESLFSLTSPQLRELGIEPARSRKYLLRWLQRYRNGLLGPGADFKHVKDGQAILKVATIPRDTTRDVKWVVNVPPEGAVEDLPEEERIKPKGYKVRGAQAIVGPFALPLKQGQGACVTVTEGMWEHKRGRKIDGGERRRAEVRFKRRIAERKAERESGYQ